jgi:hypothetical protein
MKSMSNIARLGIAALASGVMFSSVSVSAQSSANLSVGDRIVVAEAVKVRDGANGVHNNAQQRGATGTIIGGPVVTGGYTWWSINYDTGTDGWSAEDFLQRSNVALSGTTGQVAGVSTSADIQATIAQLNAQIASLLAQLTALQSSLGGHSMSH